MLRLVIAGAFVALSALQAALYWSRRRTKHLLGAAVAALVVVFIFGRYYGVAAPDDALTWSKVRLGSGFLVAWALLRVMIVEGKFQERWLRWCSHYVLLLAPLSFIDGVLLDTAQLSNGVDGQFVAITTHGAVMFIPSTIAFTVATFRAFQRARHDASVRYFRTLAPLVLVLLVLAINDTLRLLGVHTFAVLDIGIAVLAAGYVAEVARTTQRSFTELERGIERRTQQLDDATRGVEDLLHGLPDLVLVVRGTMVEPRSQEAQQRWGAQARSLAELAATEEDAHELARLSDLQLATGVSMRLRLGDDEGPFPAEIMAVSITMDGEQVVVASARDLSEREQIERRLRLNDRLASVGTLAAGVAHEINNPLTFIASNIAYVQEWLEELDDPETDDFRAALDDAGRGAERVAAIVRVLRHFGRADEAVVDVVEVQNVLEFAARLVTPTTRDRTELKLEPSNEPLAVYGDDGRITQILVNLLTNAAEAMPPDRPHHENLVTLSAHAVGDTVAVRVVDNGVGMSASQLARVFDPFFSTNPNGRGMGLGLSICHKIAGELGGTIRLQSEEGVGTQAELVLRRDLRSELVPDAENVNV